MKKIQGELGVQNVVIHKQKRKNITTDVTMKNATPLLLYQLTMEMEINNDNKRFDRHNTEERRSV